LKKVKQQQEYIMNRLIPAAQTAASSRFIIYCRCTLPSNPHHRSISTTPSLQQALPAANKKKAAPETPKASQKKVNKEKKGPSASKLEKSASAESRIESLLIKAIDAPYLIPPKPSIEEAERRYNVGRNYVIGSFQRHNCWEM
jgi:hypothetical protein